MMQCKTCSYAVLTEETNRGYVPCVVNPPTMHASASSPTFLRPVDVHVLPERRACINYDEVMPPAPVPPRKRKRVPKAP